MTNEVLMARKNEPLPTYVQWCAEVQKRAETFTGHLFRFDTIVFNYESRYKDKISATQAARDLVKLAKDLSSQFDHEKLV